MPAPHTSTPTSRVLLGLALLLLISVLSSCSKSKQPKTYPVKGSVFINGEPAKGAIVTFVPVNREQNPDLIAQGVVRDDGSFAMGTPQAGDGVPPGEYQVGIEWRGRPSGKSAATKKSVHVDKLQGRFKPSASGIRVTIEAKDNQLEPFRLNAELGAPSK